MRRTLAVAGLTGALLSGGAAGVLLGNPLLSGAQTDGTTTTTTEPTSPTESPTPAAPDEIRSTWMTDALAPLVSDGTITQVQADAVIAALEEAKPDRGPGHGIFGLFGDGLEAAAEALGMSSEDVLSALHDGSTLGELADQQQVDRTALVDAMVAPIEERLSAGVADGSLTQEEADARLADIREAITEHLDTGLPFGGPDGMGGGWGPWGHGGSDERRPAEAGQHDEPEDGADEGAGTTTS
jgi:hypothetical protein